MPPLDPYLAVPCKSLELSTQADFDAWDGENLTFLDVMADCAIRHRRLVEAWPK